MNKRGQALVEFVIILPIFIFMVLAVIDIGKILYFQNRIENKLSDAVKMYNANETFQTIEKNIEKDTKDTYFIIKENNEYIEFEIDKDISIITPGLNLILGNPYKISEKRVIYNE